MSETADSLDASLARGILLKVSFKPELMRQAQAFLLYVALEGQSFTADCLPKEVLPDAPSGEPDRTTAGAACASLRTQRLIESCGRQKSPSKSRNGAWVSVWRLATGRRATAIAWLKANGFPTEQFAQGELALG